MPTNLLSHEPVGENLARDVKTELEKDRTAIAGVLWSQAANPNLAFVINMHPDSGLGMFRMPIQIRLSHGLINFINSKAKCLHQRKLTWTWTLRQVFICLSYTPAPVTNCDVHVLIKTGKGGGGRAQPERSLEGQQFTKLGRKTNMTECISSISTLIKHLPQNPFSGNFFGWRHFALVFIFS